MSTFEVTCGPRCQMCLDNGLECVACDPNTRRRARACSHSKIERHFIEVAESRTPTKPIRQIASIAVDVEDLEAVASWLELVAKIVRTERRVRITIDADE